jgi:hypothetical protein
MMMSELQSLGVEIEKREKITSSTAISGMELSGSVTTKLVLVLPTASPLAVTFSKEGFGRKLTKLFKKEIQTGDAAFDGAIYISTDSPEATKQFLTSQDARAAIDFCVQAAGPVEIDSDRVTLEVPGHEDDIPPQVVAIVRAVIAVTSHTTTS